MSVANRVPTEDIERIVGAKRHADRHIARAVSTEQTVYVLHSQACLDSGIDLLDCPYSLALDVGIHLGEWWGIEDQAVAVTYSEYDGRLLPDEIEQAGARSVQAPEQPKREPLT